jgi:hypothetical protein
VIYFFFGSKMYCCLFLFLEIFVPLYFWKLFSLDFCSLLFQCHVHFCSLMYNNIFLHLEIFVSLILENYFHKVFVPWFLFLFPMILIFVLKYISLVDVSFSLILSIFFFSLVDVSFPFDPFYLLFHVFFFIFSLFIYFSLFLYFCSLWSSFLFPVA